MIDRDGYGEILIIGLMWNRKPIPESQFIFERYKDASQIIFKVR